MNNILFVTPSDFSESIPTGGTYGSRLHLEILRLLPQTNITTLSLARQTNLQYISEIKFIPATKNKLDTFVKNCMGYASYLSPKAERTVLQYIETGKYTILFLDISNFGRIAKKIKILFPSVKIITFFHNVEYMYVLSMIHIQGIQYLPMLYASWYNEKLAIRYSDMVIAINNRDKNIIEKKYKGHVFSVLSPWYEDYSIRDEYKSMPVSYPLEVLFLGSWFHTNVAGIKWFIDKVLPKVNIKLTVAGRDMEKLKHYYLENDKLTILGTVQNIDDVYNQADCVITPIFDGAGMKIKTGDALRRGKTVVGTREAFTGYDITHGIEGYICETIEDFIVSFDEIPTKHQTKINMDSYDFFKKNLTKGIALEKMKTVIDNLAKQIIK
jgi:hypothetical protein